MKAKRKDEETKSSSTDVNKSRKLHGNDELKQQIAGIELPSTSVNKTTAVKFTNDSKQSSQPSSALSILGGYDSDSDET